MPTLPAPIHPRRRGRRLLTGVAVALTLTAAGCGGSDGGGGNADADPASVVPASAAFYAEMTVRPEGDLKAGVEALAKKIGATQDPGAEIIKLIDDSLKDQDASFKEDIEPWLGKKIGVAITGASNPQSPDYVLVFAASDTKKALDSLKKREKGLDDRKYKDVSYTFNTKEQQAALTVNDTLVVGSEAGVKSVIDADKGGKALGGSDKLAKARKSVTSDGLGFFYVDPVAAIDLIAASTPALGAQAGQFKSLLGGASASAVGAALTVAADLIRLETAVDGQTSSKASDEAAETVAGLPTGSVAAAGFGDIGARAKAGVAQIEKLGGIYSSVLAQFKTITGLDLQADVLDWMGKGGLFLRAKGVTDIGGALVVDTNDERKSAAFIDSIDRLATQFGAGQGVTTKAFSGQGAKGIEFTIAQLGLPLYVVTGSDKFVVAVGEGSLREALEPTGTLGDDAQFKATAAKLGTKPALYVDLAAILGFADLAAGSDPSFAMAKKYLQNLTALAAGSQQSGDTTKSSVVIGVK